MNAQQAPKVTKETKNKIRVDFERTPLLQRLKAKYLSLFFLQNVVWVVFRLVLLIGLSYVILYPFFSKISGSFMSREDFVDVTVKLIPKYPTLDTYAQIITKNGYITAMLNTLILSLLCAIVQTLICCIIGYGLSKFKFRGSNLVFALVIFTMIVPHKTLQLSMFMHFKYFDVLGIFKFLGGGVFDWLKIFSFDSINLLNTYWPMALLSLGGLAFKNGLYIFMMRQFFRGVPDELEESAYIDGSGVFRTFVQIILPLSIPMMITIFLFSFSWQWTDNFYSTVFFTGTGIKLLPSIVTIPSGMDTVYAGQKLYESAILNTCGLLIIAPLVVVYLFCQRYLIQGIERSGIVG